MLSKEKNFQSQHSESGYKIDLYFWKYKIAIEVDEYGHSYRDNYCKTEREKFIKERAYVCPLGLTRWTKFWYF